MIGWRRTTGRCCCAASAPQLLAGGLTADNVAAATAAPAVDTSSGVEREIGRVEPVWNMLYYPPGTSRGAARPQETTLDV